MKFKENQRIVYRRFTGHNRFEELPARYICPDLFGKHRIILDSGKSRHVSIENIKAADEAAAPPPPDQP